MFRSVVSIIGALAIVIATSLPSYAQDTTTADMKPSLYQVTGSVQAAELNEANGICIDLYWLQRYQELPPALKRLFLPLLQSFQSCTNDDVSPYVGSISFKTGSGNMIVPEKTSSTAGELRGGSRIQLQLGSYTLAGDSVPAEMIQFFTENQPNEIKNWQLWKAWKINATPSDFVAVKSASVLVETPPYPQEALDMGRAQVLEEVQNNDPTGNKVKSQFGPGQMFFNYPSSSAEGKPLAQLCSLPVVQMNYAGVIPELKGPLVRIFAITVAPADLLRTCPLLAVYKYVDWGTYWDGLPSQVQDEVDNNIWDKGLPIPYQVSVQSQPVTGGLVQEEAWWVWPVSIVGGVLMLYFAPVMASPGQLAPGMFLIVPEPIKTTR